MPNLHVVTFYEEARRCCRCAGEGRMDLLPAWPRDLERPMSGCAVRTSSCRRSGWRCCDAGVPAARLHREVFGPELLDHLL
jgi:nitric oxide dioxygenase